MSSTPTDPTPRPMRADARRNYERLLAEARTAFTRHGTDASLEDIARRAGVGIGTLYRHFPNRTALMGAVFQGEICALLERSRELTKAPRPCQAMIDWLYWGGQLIIVGGSAASYEVLRDGFLAPYLPAEPTGENALLKEADQLQSQ